MVTMFDTITLETVPPNPEAVAGYTSGSWPTYNALVAKYPNAKHLSIAVASSYDADCLDVEPGDATNSVAPAWLKRQQARGVARPVIYTSLSNVDALTDTLRRAGIPRQAYRLWSAHYTYKPHICGPSEGIETYCDATQYTDRALGRNLDASLCSDEFFGRPAPSYSVPADEANWEKEWDRILGRKTVAAHLRRVFLKLQMVHRQRQIVQAAYQTGWNVRNRHDRYRKLYARTQSR